MQDKVVVISGGSRGIGKAIALYLASKGAKIAILAKTTEPHPKLEGTIHQSCQEIIEQGGEALAIACDIRHEEQVAKAVETIDKKWGEIDILINNASAISLTPTLATDMKKFDLMHQVNVRGTFMLSKYCLPMLKNAENPHILNIAPPLNMDAKWFKNHLAYTMAKYGMSMCVLGMAQEFKSTPIAVNALWPKTAIATAAIGMLMGEKGLRKSRDPQIMAEAAFYILSKNASEHSGRFYIDEEVLKDEGVEDFSMYQKDPNASLIPDFFI